MPDQDQIQYFYMTSLSATFEGKPVVRFNTISALNNINITASVLDRIQQSAATMVRDQNIEFTDLVIENIFCLTPFGCTEKEFIAGTQLVDQLQGDRAVAQSKVNEAVEAAQNSIQAAVNDAVVEDHAAQ